jgi:glycosyltransferase involved in cell wall biosynthesis
MTAAVREEGGRRLFGRSSANPPLVSIIVVAFRAEKELPPLLESILAPERPELEVIVIDGGSGEATVDLLRKWGDRIDYWLSEPDTGIYNAMNKGLAAATGEYILHLNAGDKLTSIPSAALRQCVADNVDVVCCRVRMDERVLYIPRRGRRMLIENVWHHQGTFYRRLAHPKYDESYRVYGDFDLNQRLAKSGKSVKLLDEVVADHQNDGISVTGKDLHSAEIWRCVRSNSGLAYVPIAFAWQKLFFLRRLVTTLRRYIASRISEAG